MKNLVKVMLLGLLVPVVLMAFDEPYFHALNGTFLLSTMQDLVPAVQRLSRYAPYPEYARAVVSIEWMFVPVYFGIWLVSLPFWTPRVVGSFSNNFIRKQGKIQWTLVFAILFMVLLVCSDVFGLRFISIYTGSGFNDHPGAGLSRMMNGSRFMFAVTVWLLCLAEVVIYYLVLIAMCATALWAKGMVSHSADTP